MKFRQELKYRLNMQDYVLIRMRLEHLLHRDPHVNEAGYYTVRSLYFDDLWNSAYFEKMNGEKERQKFRIRIYNQSPNIINLERKIKSGQSVSKQISSLSMKDVLHIQMGNFLFLKNSEENLKKLFYYQLTSRLMRPRVVVEYDREPYILETGDVRISFDSNIRAGTLGFDLFDHHLPMTETMEPGFLIMEVKYTNFLPLHIRKILPARAADFSAFSKYILCCDATLHKKHSYLK